ncbi:winged helix-turn-helix domain-containing protein [Stackebrandtia soli]|uniref:winged helix-turn-helix domain-containing protein n=1 Tax=Stackebrandtia soli TaxID=1892856 RepID=UPI0039ECAA05
MLPHRPTLHNEPSVAQLSLTLTLPESGDALAERINHVLRELGRAVGDAGTVTMIPTPIESIVDDARQVPPARLRLHTRSRLATLDGDPLPLSRVEYNLLNFLAKHPGEVFGRNRLLRSVWGSTYDGGVRTVDVHIRRLRVKLAKCGPLVTTVRGVGYRYDGNDRTELLDRVYQPGIA